ncbi:MAG: hypothetical protein OXQ31_19350 [Spirochaetaceae bacterium]|nr:hypothetical protein [Spirochaetaceae bacterium]
MVVCIDAGKAPIKGNERVDNDNRTRYDREFRDVKVAGIEHADEFFRRVWVEMNRRCSDLSKLCLVFIGDGAEWIWQRVAELDNETSCRILDFCHAADHLADLCKLLDGEGSERCRERFGRWRAQLGASGPGQLLTEMHQERDAAVGSAKRDGIQAQINYFEANRQRMNYPLYRDDGLPIGSGAVESACKNVAARMKRSGTWTLSGAKHLLQSHLHDELALRPRLQAIAPSATRSSCAAGCRMSAIHSLGSHPYGGRLWSGAPESTHDRLIGYRRPSGGTCHDDQDDRRGCAAAGGR